MSTELTGLDGRHRATGSTSQSQRSRVSSLGLYLDPLPAASDMPPATLSNREMGHWWCPTIDVSQRSAAQDRASTRGCGWDLAGFGRLYWLAVSTPCSGLVARSVPVDTRGYSAGYGERDGEPGSVRRTGPTGEG